MLRRVSGRKMMMAMVVRVERMRRKMNMDLGTLLVWFGWGRWQRT